MSLHNLNVTLNVYRRCMNGYKLDSGSPSECMSCDGMTILYWGNEGVLPNIPSRKLNVAYAVQEFLWYCRGDRFDMSILEHATMWKKLKQADGGINSNYGQYMFNTYLTPEGVQISQFEHCIGELIKNPDSRRAAMVLLNTTHLYRSNTDVVCTYGIQFMIRDNLLDMHVTMRSNDAVWGLTNDSFCFNMIQRMMCASLRQAYPSLQVGRYYHHAVSMHVYSRHYDYVKEAEQEAKAYEPINPPMMNDFDMECLLHDQSLPGGPFMDWARNVCSGN